jgi:hypothetical protein
MSQYLLYMFLSFDAQVKVATGNEKPLYSVRMHL